MPTSVCHVRTMTRPELELAIDWAAAEGWNPGLHDAECFRAADPGGFLVGLVGDEPVAAISAVRYRRSFGFLGLYIVKPKYRGRGFGMQVWNAAMEYLAGRTVGLDGVVAQQENYKKSGFTLAHKNVRYQGTGGGSLPADAAVVPLASVAFGELLAYDRSFFPDERSRFLRAWIDQPQTTGLAILHAGRLGGYGVMRTCRQGYKIGPLFAESPELADRVFRCLRAGVPPAEPIYLDLPASNAAAVALAQRHGMTPVFETARMYRGSIPDLPLDRLFGITTFELG